MKRQNLIEICKGLALLSCGICIGFALGITYAYNHLLSVGSKLFSNVNPVLLDEIVKNAVQRMGL